MMKKQVQEKLARAHYENAALYDQRYQRRRVDVPFYLTVARGPCLELGAGSGRLTRLIAARGISVTAVEREPGLLGRLQKRTAGLPVRVLAGDMRRVTVKGRFGSVLAPFHTLNHLYDWRELAALLQRVHGWLKPGGIFAFDVPLPDLYLLSRPRRYRLGHAIIDGKRYRYTESFEYDQASQIETIVAHYDRSRDRFDLPLLHRHYFPQELAALLGSAGFSMIKHDGNFSGGVLDENSEEQVIVARRSEVGRARLRPSRSHR